MTTALDLLLEVKGIDKEEETGNSALDSLLAIDVSQERKQQATQQQMQEQKRTEDVGILEQLAYGFQSTNNLVQNFIDWSEQNFKTELDDEGLPSVRSTTKKEEVRKRMEQKARKAIELKKDFPEIFDNDELQNTAAVKVGELGAYLLSPENAIPLGTAANALWTAGKVTAGLVGKAAAQAGAIGGGITAVDNALYQMVETGEIDEGDLAKVTAFGAGASAILAPALVLGGKTVSNWLTKFKESGAATNPHVRPPEMDEIPDEAQQIIKQFSSSYEQMMDAPSLPRVRTPTSTELPPDPQMLSGRLPEPEVPVVPVRERMMNTPSGASPQLSGVPRDTSGLSGAPRPAEPTPPPKPLSYKERKAKGKATLDDYLSLSNDNKGRATQAAMDMNKAMEEDAAWRSLGKKESNYRETPQYKESEAIMDSIEKMKEIDIEQAWKLAKIEEEALGRVEELKKIQAKKPEKVKVATTKKSIRDVEKHLDQVPRNMRGNIALSAATQMASAGIGATLGGAAYGEEGAIAGAALGLGVRNRKLVFNQRLSDKYDRLKTKFIPYGLRSGEGELHKWGGDVGDQLSSMMEHAEIKGHAASSSAWVPIHRKVKNWTEEQGESLLAYMRNKSLPIPDELKGVADSLNKELEKVVARGLKAGVFTGEQAKKMLKNLKKGYVPRVYNFEFLDSEAGRNAWLDMWGRYGVDTGDAQKLAHSVIGDRKLYESYIKDLAEKNIRVNSKAAGLRALEYMRSEAKIARSGHLEKARAIGLDDEVLKPFLVNDVDTIFTRYFQEAYKRIHFAEMFGKNDEVWLDGLKTIRTRMEAAGTKMDDIDKIENRLNDIYLTQVGDPNSSVLQKFSNLTEGQKSAYQVAQGMATWKLTLASILNATQGTVNSIVRLTAQNGGNPLRAFATYGKGVMRSLSEEGRREAEKSGAIAMSTLIQVMNDGAAGAGIKLDSTGIRGLLFNPQKFLRAVGFTGMEKVQRTLAANVGAEHLNSLLSRRLKAISSGKKTDAFDRELKELFIDPAVDIAADGSISNQKMLEAMLKFSNDVNFTNQSTKLPLLWQSPMGKVLTKFKSFAFNMNKFVDDNLIMPAIRDGNFTPIALFFGPMVAMGMSTDAIRRLIRQDDKKLTNTQRYIRGLMNIGGIGLWGDMVSSATYGKGAEALIGPFVGSAVGTVENVARGVTKTGGSGAGELAARATQPFADPILGAMLKKVYTDEKVRRGRRSSHRGKSFRGSNRGSNRR